MLLKKSKAVKFIAEYGNRCKTVVRFPFQSENIPSSRINLVNVLIKGSVFFILISSDTVVSGSIAATWYKIVNLENGAVTVFPYLK
jgi:hypothetical protein